MRSSQHPSPEPQVLTRIGRGLRILLQGWRSPPPEPSGFLPSYDPNFPEFVLHASILVERPSVECPFRGPTDFNSSLRCSLGAGQDRPVGASGSRKLSRANGSATAL